jgi:hypothetical protein
MSTFHGAGGGESPTRSTLALILDGSDSALGNPINRCGDIGSVKMNSSIHNTLQVLLLRFISEERLVFSLCPIRHMIVTKFVAQIFGVLFSND